MRKTLLSALQVVVVSLLLLCPVEIAFARQSKVAFISLDVVAQRSLRWDAVTKAWPHSFMRLGYSNSNEDLVEVVADAPSTITTSRYDAASSTSVVEIDIIIPNHRPLGCVIEESLASSQPNNHVVFVASITEGGAAAQAGLLPGDVVVGLGNSLLQSQPCVGTNMTTTTDIAHPVVLTNVTGWSIEKVCVLHHFLYESSFLISDMFSLSLDLQKIIHSMSRGRYSLSDACTAGHQRPGGARGGSDGDVRQS